MMIWNFFKDEILFNPIPWIFLTAAVAAWSGWVSLYKQREQSENIRGWLTGGDSWAYYRPYWTDQHKLAFFIQYVGRKYPAYDIYLKVQDEQTKKVIDGPRYIGPVLLKNRGIDWTEPESLTFPEHPTPNEPLRHLKLEISLRSGTIILQRILLWQEAGRWHSDSKQIEKAGLGPIKPPEDYPEAQDLKPVGSIR